MRGIADVTRRALRRETAIPQLSTATSDDSRALGVAAYVSGMGPLLGYWVERGVIGAAPPAQALLRAHREHAMRRHAMLAGRLGEVLAAMRAQDVAPMVLKGMHTAWQYFPDPGTRTIGDIDLLVSPHDLTRAAEALRSAGLVETQRTVRPFRSVWSPPGPRPIHSIELDHADNPWSLDLHIALERRYARGVSARVAVASSTPHQAVVINGHETSGLAQPVLTAFLGLHTSYGLASLQLARLVELVLVLRHDAGRGRLDWAQLQTLLAATGTSRFVYPAFRLVEDLAPDTVSSSFLASLERAASPRARRVVRGILDGGAYRLDRRTLDEKLMWASGPLQTFLNVTELAWPSEGTFAEVLRLWERRLLTLAREWRRTPRRGLR